MGIEVFRKHIREKRAIKIASNLIDLKDVSNISRASQIGKASAISIPCDRKIYETVKNNAKLPVFVSSPHPSDLLKAVEMGADAIEIGNFNSLGRNITAQQVYDITLEAMGMTNKYETFVCATIPSDFELTQQVALTKRFEILGVDVIQIENYNSLISSQAIISNAIEISKQTILPLICPSSINTQNCSAVFLSGLNGVNINLNQKIDSEVRLGAEILSITSSISHRNSIHREFSFTR